MTRSVKIGPFIDPSVVRHIKREKDNIKRGMIKTHSRRSTITPELVGFTFGVYNGKKYIPVTTREEMIGHKLGEFSPTRVFRGHAGDKKARR